ncbi:hypothetical protein QR46_2681 [Giardia duodenalis assemblage B]|uniref:Uncharacterized protein n=1 Tax=Giardia duodenalis assemblage B TaxID=1394984 RepID=A0A132NTE3_GIAIN|nr:hypothetical protein QR46_2681 [Giardia intestinalis assemblage B]
MIRVFCHQEVLQRTELHQAQEDVFEAVVVELVELCPVRVLDPGYNIAEHEHPPAREERVPVPALCPMPTVACAFVESAGPDLLAAGRSLHLHWLDNLKRDIMQIVV